TGVFSRRHGDQMKNTRWKLYAFLIACLIAAPLLGQNAALNWHVYRSDALGFTVTFPTDQVQAQPAQVEEKSGVKTETYIFLTKTPPVIALTGCTDYHLRDMPVDKELELDRDNFVKALNGTVTSTRKFAFGDEKLPALEFSFAAGDNVGKSLIIVKKFP